MKTDTIFYTLFQTIPGVLFELLEQSEALALHYQFTSVEIKELALRISRENAYLQICKQKSTGVRSNVWINRLETN